MVDKLTDDTRRAAEFISEVRPYTFAEAMQLDVVTFYRVLFEAEQQERERIKASQTTT